VGTVKKRVLFAAGGTMGHIGPARVVATRLKELNPQIEITFIGTRSGLEREITLGFPLAFIVKAPLPRSFTFASILFPIRFTFAILQSLFLASRCDLIIGFGGYVSTPVYIAGKILRKPLIIHEANAVPGFANKLSRQWAKRLFVNDARVAKEWSAERVGIPLRSEIVALASNHSNHSNHSNYESETDNNSVMKRILVLGGSLGSARINRAIWEWLEYLKEKNVEYSITHALGRGDFAKGEKFAQNFDRYYPVELIEDMASAYRQADLIISRGGAVTCAEIRELGKRAVIVPLPHGNGEQRFNAEPLSESGHALLVDDKDFSSSWLAINIDRAFELSNKPPEVPLLDATEAIATAIVDILKKGR
jgi:UDP-N-acetylglucosamine--N-acetylmuramyl-(pentapeptide) pyrophosphoryl-undecaprenol N-acetylglucosamine transferase